MRSRVRVQRIQHGRALFDLGDRLRRQSDLEAFAAKLMAAKEVFVVWRKGTIQVVTPEEYIRRGALPVGARAFLERGEAEALADSRKKKAAEETRGPATPTRRE